MIEFYQTGMGRAFFEHTMPRIAEALERLVVATERDTAATEKMIKTMEGPLAVVRLDVDGQVRVMSEALLDLEPDVAKAIDLACDILKDLGESMNLGKQIEGKEGTDAF